MIYESELLPHSSSILDSQLYWKSGKFQLARWSHKVAILCSWNHPPHQFEIRRFVFFFQCCEVCPPQLFPPLTEYMQCPALPLYVLLCSLPASPNLYLAPVELSIKLNLYLSGALLAELVDCKLWYCILCGIQYIRYVIWCMIYNISYVIWIMWHMVYNTSYRKYKIKDTIYDIWNIINII